MTGVVSDEAIVVFLKRFAASRHADGSSRLLGEVVSKLSDIDPPTGLMTAHKSLTNAWTTGQRTYQALAEAERAGSKRAAKAIMDQAVASIGPATSSWLPDVQAYAHRHGYPPPDGFKLRGGYSPE
jgi:hypothetical protein